jgi:hypothetical protein
MLHSPTLPALISSAIPVTITLTSFSDNLALFFGNQNQLTLGLQTLQKFHNIVEITGKPS